MPEIIKKIKTTGCLLISSLPVEEKISLFGIKFIKYSIGVEKI